MQDADYPEAAETSEEGSIVLHKFLIVQVGATSSRVPKPPMDLLIY